MAYTPGRRTTGAGGCDAMNSAMRGVCMAAVASVAFAGAGCRRAADALEGASGSAVGAAQGERGAHAATRAMADPGATPAMAPSLQGPERQAQVITTLNRNNAVASCWRSALLRNP